MFNVVRHLDGQSIHITAIVDSRAIFVIGFSSTWTLCKDDEMSNSWCVNLPQLLYHDDGSLKGIATNDVGIHKDGAPKVSAS